MPSSRRVCLTEPLEKRTLLSDVPAGFTETTIAGGLFSPTAMALAPDGRIFVTEQTGAIRIIKNGQLLSTPFLTASVTSYGEHGLLGIVLDPNFQSNGFVYYYYTTTGTPFHNRLARATTQGDVAKPGSIVTLLDTQDLSDAPFHDGGALHFGNDGKLYVATGDNENQDNSQSLSNLQGKILRLNPDGSIPTDNPTSFRKLSGSTSGINRAIWAVGFRNPFTFAVQPETGRIFVNDVGQDLFEEINDLHKGGNYGWPNQEGGNHAGTGYDDALLYYDHGVGFAVTGGVFYPTSGGSFPSQYKGKYFVSNIVTVAGPGWIKLIDPSSGSPQLTDFASNVAAPVDLDIGSDGALYYLGRTVNDDTQNASGFVAKIQFSVGQAPAIISQPGNRTVARGQDVTFTVGATGASPLNYQWQRNGNDISGATSSSYTLNHVDLSDDGAQFRVIVSNSVGTVTSSAARLTVQDNSPPTVRIVSPTKGSTFQAGQMLGFSARGSDVEDGDLAASQFTWQVDYHTGDVVRPFIQPQTGSRSGAFTIPTQTPYKRTDVFYRLLVTVTDSGGVSTSGYRDILPLVSTIKINSNIAGISIDLDNQPKDAPQVFASVQGVQRALGADEIQNINGVNYRFDHWSDGGDIAHVINTPDEDTTYTAFFAPVATKGLAATYFNNRNFTGTQINETDSTVDFDFGSGSPHDLIGNDTFSARWLGKVQASTSETYTFTVRTDGGVRLIVNDQVLFDQFNNDGLREFSGQIDLSAGQKYNLRLEYIHNTGNAVIQLRWSSNSVNDQVVPKGALFQPLFTTAQIQPSDDAFVQGGDKSDDNFGNDASLLVKNYKDDRFRRDSYLKFSLDGQSAIRSARLRVFGSLNTDAIQNLAIGLYGSTNSSWDESDINFDNRPALTDLLGQIQVSTREDQWYEFDVSEFVRRRKALGDSAVSFALLGLDSSSGYASFMSRNSADHEPQLVITA